MPRQTVSIVVLFGGQSGEHEVSLNSAQSVIQAINRSRYIIKTVAISPQGQWYWGVQPEEIMMKGFPIGEAANLVTLVHDPTQPHFRSLTGRPLPDDGKFDIIFPILHGPFGEDGTVQGLLEMASVPYVGSGVLGSALGMDKDRMKAVFVNSGLPVGKYLTFLRSEYRAHPERCLNHIETALGYPCFVKPANLGSSVGISKAHDRAELERALELAAIYDRKLVIEENIPGREVEVSVLGNDQPMASLPGEILPAREFYDYEAKYIDAGSRLLIPADLAPGVVAQLQEIAVQAFRAVEACGLARVDFFVTPDNRIMLNEINTLPGFTEISMYPKLWEISGIPYSELIDRLIELGFERFRDSRNRKIART